LCDVSAAAVVSVLILTQTDRRLETPDVSMNSPAESHGSTIVSVRQDRRRIRPSTISRNEYIVRYMITD
jgi:hypothetical protein